MELLTPSWALTVWVIFSALIVLFWLMALIDILKNRFAGEKEKLIWILIILFLPFIGTILYFIIGRKRRVNVN